MKKKPKRKGSPLHAKNAPIASFSLTDPIGQVCFQLEMVSCGKASCGRLHGPYWRAYWSWQGRMKSRYVGKALPPAIARRAKRLGAIT